MHTYVRLGDFDFFKQMHGFFSSFCKSNLVVLKSDSLLYAEKRGSIYSTSYL